MLRGLVHSSLGSILGHRILIQDSLGGAVKCSQPGEVDSTPTIHVQSPEFYRRVVMHGALGAAESYRRGEWVTSDLVELLRTLARHLPELSRIERAGAIFLRPFRLVDSWLRRNSRSGSKKNISAHYDLSNDFFELMLDPTMTYSSGIFSRPEMSLKEAQLEKFDQVCRKLNLREGDRLLEIGTGWGGFAEYAALHYGCHVTTTTISDQQYEYVRQRLRERQLDSCVKLVKQDYRDIDGQFDKLVSIEMVEAVGHQFLGRYFAKCSRLLKPTGMMCLQVITIPDHRYDHYRRSVDFIQRYIFPGGCLPSFSVMTRCLAKATDFRLLQSQDFGFDYAATLRHWRSNFWEHIERVRSLGFDDKWIRTWDFYLCYCIAGFLERQIGVSQIVLAKPQAHRLLADGSGFLFE